jgi:DNA primase
MQADELQDLMDSIHIIGVQNPITLLDGMVLDGWHRYSIATGFSMDCPMVELPDDIDPRDFVKAQNSARRHMTRSQTALAFTELYAWRPAHREKKVEVTSTLSKTNAEIAEIAGVSSKTIQHAKAVHAGGIPAIHDAVKAGTISLESAAAIARMPTVTQQAIAAQGPDAMRVATKARRKSARNTSAALPAVNKKQQEAERIAAEAHGDFDLIALLEASEEKNTQLCALLAAAEADDKQAEIIKWHRIADISQRRQNELMDMVNQRERELQRQAKLLRRIGAALDEPDNSKLPALVETLTRSAMMRTKQAALMERN